MSLEDYIRKQKDTAVEKAGDIRDSAREAYQDTKETAQKKASDIGENFT